MPLVLGHALLAALVLAGAKPTPSPAGASKKSGPALSYLKLREDEVCDWMRKPLPAGEPELLFSFNAYCGAASVAWSPDGKQGVVAAEGTGAEPGLRVWRVDLVKRTGTRVDLTGLPKRKLPTDLDVPAINRLSFDPQGRLVALVSYVLVANSPKMEPDGKRYISFEDQRYPVVEGEGDPAIEMAYRLEGDTWTRIELKSTSFGDFQELETARKLQPVADLGGVKMSPGQEPAAPARKLLRAAFPDKKEGMGEGKWLRLTTPGGPIYYREEPEGDGYARSPPVRWGMGRKLVPVEGVPDKQGTYVSFQLQRELLLIHFESGEGPMTLVLNAKTKKRLLSLEDLYAPALWPGSSKR